MVNMLNDIYDNLLSISRGDIGTFQRVTDDFAKPVQSYPIDTNRDAEAQTPEIEDNSSH